MCVLLFLMSVNMINESLLVCMNCSTVFWLASIFPVSLLIDHFSFPHVRFCTFSRKSILLFLCFFNVEPSSRHIALIMHVMLGLLLKSAACLNMVFEKHTRYKLLSSFTRTFSDSVLFGLLSVHKATDPKLFS